MKKLILSVFAAAMLVSLMPVQAKAENAPIPVTTTTTTAAVNETAEAQAMLARLNEIKAMDMKSLSSAQKKALRHEVKDMKSHMKGSGGIYLSIGAIVIILLIVLLLL